MKREIEEEEQEERLVRKMFRGVSLPEKEGWYFYLFQYIVVW